MPIKRELKFCFIAILCIFISGCNEDYIAKPKAYHRIKLPEKTYQLYNNPNCPFSFQYPTYSSIIRDSLFFNQEVENPCWFDINFKEFQAKVHVTYKELNENCTLAECIEDAHTMTFKHTKKADFIDESAFINKYNAEGIIYDVGGDAASALQFYITDKQNHFLRGSLYFSTTPNADSLAPVIKFVKEDMMHMLNTFRWHEL